MDIRRFVPPGVTVRPGVVLPPGVRFGVLAPEGERLWSGVRDGVSRSFTTRLGVSSELTLFTRGDAVVFADSPPLLSPRLASRIESAFWLSALDFLPPPVLGLRFGTAFSAESGAIKVPGPMDFLGAWAFTVIPLLKAFGGKWLCLRPFRIDVVVVVVDMVSARVALAPAVVDAVEPFLPIEAEAFLIVETGNAGCVVFFCSSCVGPLVPFALPLPGMGKWLKLGSEPVMLLWKSSKLIGARKSAKSSGSFNSSCGVSCCGIDARLKRDISLMFNWCV
jgi:hypothetical protein